jgi:ubiquinone/menaquinone biosynthesis C-methylase UbiE
MWQAPESELGVLGEVAGKEVLELGCGAAQWSILLAREGARAVGLDDSERQLEHARAAVTAAGVEVRLVHASAESLPFPDESFDIVFADHGANRFVDPYAWVPEAARVLRRGGRLAFSESTPWEVISWDDARDTVSRELRLDYFGLRRLEDEDGLVQFYLPYGDWIRLFRDNGLLVEALREIQPPAGAESTYRNADETEWARHWPMEHIWSVRKE